MNGYWFYLHASVSRIMICSFIHYQHSIVANRGAGKQPRSLPWKANTLCITPIGFPLGRNGYVADIARIATLPPPNGKARPHASTNLSPLTRPGHDSRHPTSENQCRQWRAREANLCLCVIGKHPTHRANRVNPLGGNCNVAHIARIATVYMFILFILYLTRQAS